jgi:CheY-like chemotaxis protein/HPt (histidine-containing phosphotransfer) domain-containing protein
VIALVAPEARTAGVAACITKPVSQPKLLDSLRAVFGGGEGEELPLAGSAGTEEEPRQRLRILLTEDNAVNQRVATAMLKRRGHDVEVVENGRAAVEAVGSSRYDVVLMDVQMPEMDGIEATRRIRANGSGIRIVALTAHATADDRTRCLEAGMNDFLTKPFAPRDLFQAVDGGRSAPGGAAAGPGAAGATDPEAVAAPVDIDGFRASMEEAGVGEIVDETLRTYLHEFPDRIDCLRNAMASRDTEDVRKAAHALKSSSAAIGARELARLLEETEALAKAGDLGEARKRLAGILDASGSVVVQLERALAVTT